MAPPLGAGNMLAGLAGAPTRHLRAIIATHFVVTGKLTQNLADKLVAHGVTLSPIPSDQVFAALEQQGRIDPFTRLLAAFLHHFKSALGERFTSTPRIVPATKNPSTRCWLSTFRQTAIPPSQPRCRSRKPADRLVEVCEESERGIVWARTGSMKRR